MNRLVIAVLLIVSVIGFAQMPPVKRGSTVYIEPMDGYEAYIAAALLEKHVPLVIVADKTKAEYIIRGTVSSSRLGSAGYAAAIVVANASVNLIDAQSSQIVFAHSAGKGGLKGTAEDCAKHLKAFIEKPPK